MVYFASSVQNKSNLQFLSSLCRYNELVLIIKYTKFIGGWGSTPGSKGGAYDAPQIP